MLQQLKRPIGRWLQQTGRLEGFRDSAPYSWYLRLFFPAFARRKALELEVYRRLLPDDRLIFDIGANIGSKAILFTKLAAQVVCVEPDAACVDVLRRRFQRNPDVRIVHAAVVGDSAGTGTLFKLAGASSYNTLSPKWLALLTDQAKPRFASPPEQEAGEIVPTTTLDRLIARFGTPSYIKIDVEGSELSVIKGLSTTVPLVSFEAILPEFREETLQILDLLHARAPDGRFNYCLDDPGPELASPEWLTYDAMRAFVGRGEGLLMEIYFRS
ncbi:MAG: FkbM family methyltransferase [Acidobacteria bacterium]|nr:FkbM family methyltransferase [Acidobacteriota bacterium]